MELNIQQYGLFLEMIGVFVIFLAQIWFLIKAYRKYRKKTFLKRALLELTVAQFGLKKKKLKELPDEEINKTFKKFNLANWFREDLLISLIGLSVTLIGIILQF